MHSTAARARPAGCQVKRHPRKRLGIKPTTAASSSTLVAASGHMDMFIANRLCRQRRERVVAKTIKAERSIGKQKSQKQIGPDRWALDVHHFDA